MSTAAAPQSKTGGFTRDAHDTFLRDRDEPEWLIARRREALSRMETAPWPTLRDEEWRRTDIRMLKLATFAPPRVHEPSAESRTALAQAHQALGAHYATGLLQIDGAVVHQPATAAQLPPGVVFTDLATAAREHPELLRRFLHTEAVDPAIDVFSALHAAFWTGGVLLHVPKGVKVETPLYHLVGLSSEGAADLSHALVILEDGAEATLVQETASSG
jgi:Fe-S cluster assembly protein SufD